MNLPLRGKFQLEGCVRDHSCDWEGSILPGGKFQGGVGGG